VNVRRSKFNLQLAAIPVSNHGSHHSVDRHACSLRSLLNLLRSLQDAIGVFLGE
jgi:hypothetical protein